MVSKQSHILRHSRGPQFKIKGGPLLFLLCVACCFIGIVSLIMGNYVVALILFVFGVMLFALVLNICGFELDSKAFKVRGYKKFLWMKFGKWDNIQNYNAVYLTKGKVVVRTSDFARRGHTHDNYYYYFVKLVDEFNKHEIILSEFKDFKKAQRLMKIVANALQIKGKVNIRKIERIR